MSYLERGHIPPKEYDKFRDDRLDIVKDVRQDEFLNLMILLLGQKAIKAIVSLRNTPEFDDDGIFIADFRVHGADLEQIGAVGVDFRKDNFTKRLIDKSNGKIITAVSEGYLLSYGNGLGGGEIEIPEMVLLGTRFSITA